MDTFFWYWQLPTLCNLDWLDWSVSWCLGHVFDLLDDVVALEDLAENNMLSVKMSITIVSCSLRSGNIRAYPGVEVVMKN